MEANEKNGYSLESSTMKYKEAEAFMVSVLEVYDAWDRWEAVEVQQKKLAKIGDYGDYDPSYQQVCFNIAGNLCKCFERLALKEKIGKKNIIWPHSRTEIVDAIIDARGKMAVPKALEEVQS